MSTGHSSQPWRFAPNAPLQALPPVDTAALANDLKALRAELAADLGPADLAHLRKMARWGRTCTLLGWLTCWFPNPLAVLALSLGNVARWTMVGHHVLHRGYDQVPGTPPHWRSDRFSKGWRRWIDWLDWMHPAAWSHEHNQLHHFHLNEFGDPDLVEHNAWLLRRRWLPAPLKWLLASVLMLTWKFSYYAPNTWRAWRLKHRHAARDAAAAMGHDWRLLYPGERVLLPLSAEVPGFWWHCVLPYALGRFGLLPLPFLLISPAAWTCALVSLLLAELLANLHAFVIIVPNHAGADLCRYDDHHTDPGGFYLRQILGSVNYPGGSDWKDFLQGYLNYQIEHHVWPDLPMLKYRQAAPRLQAICAKHGIAYVSEPVWRRFARMWAVLVGRATMRRVATADAAGAPGGSAQPELNRTAAEAQQRLTVAAGD